MGGALQLLLSEFYLRGGAAEAEEEDQGVSSGWLLSSFYPSFILAR